MIYRERHIDLVSSSFYQRRFFQCLRS